MVGVRAGWTAYLRRGASREGDLRRRASRQVEEEEIGAVFDGRVAPTHSAPAVRRVDEPLQVSVDGRWRKQKQNNFSTRLPSETYPIAETSFTTLTHDGDDDPADEEGEEEERAEHVRARPLPDRPFELGVKCVRLACNRKSGVKSAAKTKSSSLYETLLRSRSKVKLPREQMWPWFGTR